MIHRQLFDQFICNRLSLSHLSLLFDYIWQTILISWLLIFELHLFFVLAAYSFQLQLQQLLYHDLQYYLNHWWYPTLSFYILSYLGSRQGTNYRIQTFITLWVNQGKWAIVTGGTDGIGLGFSQVLAQIGWNLCIISRNQEKMKKTIERISESLKKQGKKIPKFKLIIADFKDSSKEGFFQRIRSQLSQIKIGILVNNVGTSDIINYYDLSLQQIKDWINVNCVSMAALTNTLSDKLRSQKSALINLSSYLGQTCAPYSTLYSATKAFNTHFSQSLSMQKGYNNVDILSVKPMFVESPLSKQKKSFTVPDRRQCARACLKQLAWQYETYGYFVHRIMGILGKPAPKWLKRRISIIMGEKMLIEYHNS